MSPAVRRIRYHDPDAVRLREDLIVMYASPSIDSNAFHEWLQRAALLDGVLAPKETRTFSFEAKRGWHDVSCPAVHALSFLIARDEGPSEVTLELFDGQMVPPEFELKKGPVTVRVHNNLDAGMPFYVAFLGDDTDVHPARKFTIRRFLTGKRVLANQTFHRLFKADAIEVGTGLEIKNLTVLFTDLQMSTAMYVRVGDLKALDIVRRHFLVLEAVVARHQGAVVKTIGDAVMAVFAEPDKAMAAATQMIDNVRQAVAYGEDLVLKIGMHSGPCVAIQSNNQLDYFGSTVNIASRVQDLASGGEIVCSEDVWRAPGVQERVRERGLAAARETAHLKGIGDRYAVRRVVVAAGSAAQPLKARPQRVKPAAPPRKARAAARKPRAAPLRNGRAAPAKRRARA
ncbi:MAG: adenylate/guanylate cyclase domain-containing protein [Candidatus Lambdaproteobacteria bacterium]|nr:adenylate/guanylate cyclase domain-containing protein [Candidatus Lambdaproteobacteria bacterium]